MSYGTSNGTATAGSDYTAKSGTLTFSREAAGSQTFTVQTIEDTLDESGGEAFSVTIASPSGGGGPAPILARSSVRTTINDDDGPVRSSPPTSPPPPPGPFDPPDTTSTPPTVPTRITLRVSPSELREGSGAVDVTVTATLRGNNTLSTPTDVAISLADGTATSADYETATTIVTIPAGRSSGSGTLKVQTVDDTIVEPSETISVAGTAEGYSVSSAYLTILDNDASSVQANGGPSGSITLTVSPSSVREHAGATTFTVTAAWDDGAARGTDTVVTIGALAGTATENSDYSVTSALASITIPANYASGSGKLSIDPRYDGVTEGDETILVTGSTSFGLDVNSTEITLSDSSWVVATGPSQALHSRPHEPRARRVCRPNSPSPCPLGCTGKSLVPWSAILTGDSATLEDLDTTSGTVTFEAGSPGGATRTIAVSVTDDALSETAESFTLSLGPISPHMSSQVFLDPEASSASATIAESDPITVHLSGPSSVEEGDTTSSYTVALLPSGVTPTAKLTVEYGTNRRDGKSRVRLHRNRRHPHFYPVRCRS